MTSVTSEFTSDNAEKLLKMYFGYDKFRLGQKEIVESILKNKDTFAVMPTGAGKSICYQIPAMMLRGITLVISPLISLMQDQVKSLNEVGIKAAYINSSLSERAFSEVISRAREGKYKILYVAPERLESNEFEDFVSSIHISMVTVDEAHCISQWGQDFRPSYLKIAKFVCGLKTRPIVSAFTATATEKVRKDVICSLGLNNPHVLVTGFDRENLFFQVETPKSKDKYILDYLKEHKDESGIIYCSTRKNVEKLYELLSNNSFSVAKYHAGMSNKVRKNMQDDFVYDYKTIIIATNAFGMGIDKSNVRFVFHYNMPQSMENYYQEVGRAGRDGLDSKGILLFSAQDFMINLFLLEHKEIGDMSIEDRQSVRERDMARLRLMENYCHTTECLRNYILSYFGEKVSEPCHKCFNCLKEFEQLDMTYEAKQIINCVYEAKGRYGTNVIIDTVTGAKKAKLDEYGTVNYKTYGVLKNENRSLLNKLIYKMLVDEYLNITGEYRLLTIGPNMSRLKDKATKVIINVCKEEPKINNQVQSTRKVRATNELTSGGNALFDKLRALRMEFARKEKMPPYIIFSDKTLTDMCVKKPATKADMLKVLGVGERKYEKYGKTFLECINKHIGINSSIINELVKEKTSNPGIAKHKTADELTIKEYEMFRKLSELRLSIAKNEDVPAFVIFGNKILVEMCIIKPRNKAEMLHIYGIGEDKFKKYGEAFLACINGE